METAQPALLYLVPCVLLSTSATALVRGEFKMLWEGKSTWDYENVTDEAVTHVDGSRFV